MKKYLIGIPIYNELLVDDKSQTHASYLVEYELLETKYNYFVNGSSIGVIEKGEDPFKFFRSLLYPNTLSSVRKADIIIINKIIYETKYTIVDGHKTARKTKGIAESGWKCGDAVLTILSKKFIFEAESEKEAIKKYKSIMKDHDWEEYTESKTNFREVYSTDTTLTDFIDNYKLVCSKKFLKISGVSYNPCNIFDTKHNMISLKCKKVGHGYERYISEYSKLTLLLRYDKRSDNLETFEKYLDIINSGSTKDILIDYNFYKLNSFPCRCVYLNPFSFGYEDKTSSKNLFRYIVKNNLQNKFITDPRFAIFTDEDSTMIKNGITRGESEPDIYLENKNFKIYNLSKERYGDIL